MTRIDRARELFVLNPDWGRRQVNTQLKQEFGKGLRWSSLGDIGRDLGRPASLRAQLVVAGFSPRERRIMSKFIRGGARGYIKDCIADRLKLKLRAEKQGLTRQQFWAMVRQHYLVKKWVTPKTSRNKARIGRPDIYAMLKYFRRRRDIEQDSPGLGQKPHHKPYRLLDKAKVLAQKAKYRAKRQAGKLTGERPSGDVKDWIRDLRETITKTTDPVRVAQLERQITRLEATQ